MKHREMIRGLCSTSSVIKEILLNFDLAIIEAKKEVFDDIENILFPNITLLLSVVNKKTHIYYQLKEKHLGSAYIEKTGKEA